MRGFTVFILYILIATAFMQNLWWFLIPAVVLFSFLAQPVYLMPLAIVLDGYFGNFYTFPWLSVSVVGWYIIVEYLRPKLINLRGYNVHHE